MGGHGGIQNTVDLLSENLYFDKLPSIVSEYVIVLHQSHFKCGKPTFMAQCLCHKEHNYTYSPQ